MKADSDSRENMPSVSSPRTKDNGPVAQAASSVLRILNRDYLLACFLDSFETNKIRCKIHVTYQFVVAQPNVPAMTAPLFHGKPREETDTSRPHPTAIPPTPQLLYSPRTTEGRLSVGSSSLPKKETARVSKINPSAFKGKNFVANSL